MAAYLSLFNFNHMWSECFIVQWIGANSWGYKLLYRKTMATAWRSSIIHLLFWSSLSHPAHGQAWLLAVSEIYKIKKIVHLEDQHSTAASIRTALQNFRIKSCKLLSSRVLCSQIPWKAVGHLIEVGALSVDVLGPSLAVQCHFLL